MYEGLPGFLFPCSLPSFNISTHHPLHHKYQHLTYTMFENPRKTLMDSVAIIISRLSISVKRNQ